MCRCKPPHAGAIAGVGSVTKMAEFYKVPEFLREFSTSRTSLYRAVKAGQIRITKQGRASRIAKADALAWANSLPTIGGGA